MKGIYRFLFLWSFADVTGKFHIERSGILPVNSKSFGIQFYITIANDAKTLLTITPKIPKCCWKVEENDVDCKSMELVGGNEIQLSPTTTRNMTYVFPNKYSMDRVGNCKFVFVSGDKQLLHVVHFNTTESRKTSWLDVIGFGGGSYRKCRGIDLDPRKDCRPVDCVEKYNGWRNFFRNSTGKCEVVHDCYTKGKRKDELPEIAFDKDHNDCKSLVSAELTKQQKKQIHDNMEKSKLAKLKYTLEDIKAINPIPLKCHHGRRVGSVCVCEDGWKTETSGVPNRDLRYIYDWCNLKIKKKSKYSGQRALLLTGLGLVSFTLLVGWLIILWSCFISTDQSREEWGAQCYRALKNSLNKILTKLKKIASDLWRGKQHGYVHTSYVPKTEKELRLMEGKIVQDITQTDYEGWWEGSCDGVRGYFHRDFVVLKSDSDSNQTSS